MTDINEEIKDLLTQYAILIEQFKEIYPRYKSSPEDSETQIQYENIQSQIQHIFSQMESINMELAKNNENNELNMNELNNKIKDSRKYYSINKPILQQKVDSNKSAVPREKEIDTALNKKYIEFAYILVLLGITIYSLRKLLY